MSERRKRIVFPFVEAGYGHIMPMKAVADVFEEKYGDRCEVIRTNFYGDSNNEALVACEKKLIKQVFKMSKYPLQSFIYKLASKLGGHKATTRFPWKTWYKSSFIPALERMKDFEADLIFNTYYSTLYYACEAKKRGLIDSKVAAYCPDPFISEFLDRRVDLMTISTDIGKERAEKQRGFKKTEARIEVVPFLLQKKVKDYTKTKEEYKQELGLDPKKFTILLCDGSYGVGKIKKTVKQLMTLPHEFNLIAVCGKNEQLYEEFKQITPPSNITFLPFGFTDKMLILSAASDLFIGKSGASNMAEANYFSAPVIITLSPSPVEKLIARYHLKYSKTAIKARRVKTAVKKAEEFMLDRGKMQYLVDNCKKHARSDGAEMLADLLWEGLDESGGW